MFTSEVRLSLFTVLFTKDNIPLWGKSSVGLQLVVKYQDILTSEFLYNTLYCVCDTLENWGLGNKHSCRFSVEVPLVLSDISRSANLPYPESQWIFRLVLRLNLICPQQPWVGIIPRFCGGRNGDSERFINLLEVPEPVSGPVRI